MLVSVLRYADSNLLEHFNLRLNGFGKEFCIFMVILQFTDDV